MKTKTQADFQMEYLEKVLVTPRTSDFYVRKEFFKLCNAENQLDNLEKILSNESYKNRLNGVLLTEGLIGALKSNQLNYIPVLLNFIKENNIAPNKNEIVDFLFYEKETTDTIDKDAYMNVLSQLNIDLDIKQLNFLFNTAVELNYIDFAHKLDENFNLMKKSISGEISSIIMFTFGSRSSWAELQEDGSLNHSCRLGGKWFNAALEKEKRSINPFLFMLEKSKHTLLDSFLEKSNQINPLLIKNALVRSVSLKNKDAVFYLFGNEKCVEIIKNSNDLINFIRIDDDLDEEKTNARIMLSAIELKSKLCNDNKITSKMKI